LLLAAVVHYEAEDSNHQDYDLGVGQLLDQFIYSSLFGQLPRLLTLLLGRLFLFLFTVSILLVVIFFLLLLLRLLGCLLLLLECGLLGLLGSSRRRFLLLLLASCL
jgi:hypothetical protein